MNTKRLKTNLLMALGLAVASPAMASVTWSGTADYKLAGDALGVDEDVVGSFDTYKFGNGVALIRQTGASSLVGYYQTMVVQHQDTVNFSAPGAPNLNTSGSLGTGTGYEITATATFTATFQDQGTRRFFDITGGSVALYFDTTPDYNFSTDTGFTNGSPLLWGTIAAGGGGSIDGIRGAGYNDLDLIFSGGLNGFDNAVFNPGNIGGGTANFTIKAASAAGGTSISSVFNNARTPTDGIFSASGELHLTAVPLPTAAWLFGSGLIGLVGTRVRKSAT